VHGAAACERDLGAVLCHALSKARPKAIRRG
jgi:hypothetical protein